MRRLTAALVALGVITMTAEARADEVQIAPGQVDLDKDKKPEQVDEVPPPPPEAPPPTPYKRTVVLDSTLGAIAFLGEFGKVAPPGPWLHTQLGVEILKWLMFFGEGELAYSDTSGRQDPPKTRAFPIFGFGGGARFTIRFTDRFGVYLQGSAGAMKTDISRNALTLLGFRDAESFGLYAAARLGLEWYQIDRHFALGLTGAIRNAQPFARVGGSGDTPLVADGGVSIRYAF